MGICSSKPFPRRNHHLEIRNNDDFAGQRHNLANITSVTIHQGVTINGYAFANCRGLTLVYVICNPEQEAGWRALNFQGQFDINANAELKFIPERLINGIINRIKLHLPGQCLERLVIPGNLGEVLESPKNTQIEDDTQLSLLTSRVKKLVYNNHLAGQRQRLEIQPHL